jgi:hypothetical protein
MFVWTTKDGDCRIGLSFGTYPQLFLQKKLLIIWSKILYSETYYKSAEDRICNNLDTYVENFKQNLPNTPYIYLEMT